MNVIPKGFKFFFWNARSLLNKIDQTRLLIEEKRPSIFCINETWLKTQIPDSMLSLKDYTLIRSDRTFKNTLGYTRGGGLALYVKNGINFVNLDSQPHTSSGADLEVQTVRINRKLTRPMYIISIYRPPTGNIETMYNLLTELLSSLDDLDKATIIMGGDFNIDFHKPKSHGVQAIKKLSKKFALETQIKDPTRPLYNDSTLDQILTNSKIIKSSGTLEINMSDHVPIFINIKKEKTTYPKATFTGRTYKNFEEITFINKLREAGFAEIPTHYPEPNQCWDRLYNTIIEVLNVMAPLRTSTFRKDRPEWLTADLIEIMKDRDRVMKLACRSKLTFDKKNARVLRNHVNKAVKAAKSEYLLAKLDTYKKDPKKFWQAINDILPHSKNSAINILSEDGTTLSDQEMSETINNFFANVGASLASKIPHTDDTPVANEDFAGIHDLEFINYRDEHIAKVAKNICIYKSSGISLIASKIWIILYKEFTSTFTCMYNNVINLGCYPDKWKIATVIPIPKIANSTTPNELRPISLLPLPGKVLEHLIHDPLQKHLENNNMLNSAQNGFRPKRSTTQTVFQYTSDLYQNLNINKDTVAVYVDFRKAFDTVAHGTLLKKLKLYKLSPKYLRILENYLDNRKQLTQINTTTSNLKPVPFGVPQGSILGPTLFILYINDIINVITKCSYYLYADDMVIYTPILDADSMQNVQTDVNAIYKWCNKNKLTINVSKTKAQYFPRNSNIQSKTFESNNPIFINNSKLQYEQHFRYLGVELDQSLSMKNTFDQIYKNASHKLYIYRLIRGSLTMFAATQVLKTMFVSVLDYGNIFITGINQDTLQDLQKLQNDALRCCLNVKNPRDVHIHDMHEQLNLHLLDHRRTVQLLSCIRKCINNNYLSYIKPEDVILRNQSFKIKMPIPRNDIVKKSPYYWGSMIWNRLPEDLRLLDDTLLFKKQVYHALMNGTLRTEFIL